MTLEEIEELGNITKGKEKTLDDHTAMVKETIDSLAKAQMQQNEKIDFITDVLMVVLKSQEKK